MLLLDLAFMTPCNILIHLSLLCVLAKHLQWDLFCLLLVKKVRDIPCGFQGQATDIQIHAKEILSLKERLNKIYSKHTGKSVEEIAKALERDYFMTAEEAKTFGLVDSVVEKRK